MKDFDKYKWHVQLDDDTMDRTACKQAEKIENGELYTKQQIEYIAKIVRKIIKEELKSYK